MAFLHETLSVLHKRTKTGCTVWLVCSCTKSHRFTTTKKVEDDEGDHTNVWPFKA